jgi:hypothetical protein
MKVLNLVLTLLFHSLRALGRARAELVLENLALRRQVTLLQETVGRPRWQREERVLWIALRRSWRRWRDALVLVRT